MRHLILCCFIGLVACDRNQVEQDSDFTADVGTTLDGQRPDIREPIQDAGFMDSDANGSPSDATVDGAAPLDAGTERDVSAHPQDAAPDAMSFPPPVDPSPELDCNALDDDGDGLVDEGAANLCGGCGPIPETGCQFWRVNLIQGAGSRLNPNRVVGLSGTILGTEVVEIDNGLCEVVRLVSRHPEGEHIGAVRLDGSNARWTLTPVLDQQAGVYRYGSDEPIGEDPLFRDGDDVVVNGEGGPVIGAFEDRVTAPLGVAEVGEFDPLFEALRAGPIGELLRLTWRSNLATNGQLKLYIGGSLVTFRERDDYQAIEHFVLDGLLVDDGELSLPEAFFGTGIPGSSIWIYLIREGGRRLVLGPHSVSIPIGRRVEARVQGGIALGDEPPFSIEQPNPSTGRVEPGEDLTIRWSQLPEGPGPLELRFSSRNPERNVQTLVSCTVRDPEVGSAVIPATLTSEFSVSDASFNQITLRWVKHRAQLPGPDRGTFEHSASVILNLSDR